MEDRYKADVPGAGIQGHLEDFREEKLEMLLDVDLVQEAATEMAIGPTVATAFMRAS